MFSVLHNRCVSVGLFAGLALGMPLEAHASVVVSTKPTQNMSCVSGVCAPTAKDAVLNVADLTTMLSGGDVTIQSASIAPDIIVKAALSWASTSRLTFDSYRSVEIDKPVTATGTGAMTITTNDGGSNGDLSFVGKGNVAFWDLNSSLVINGQSYVLVGDIATLAADIADNPSGFYALAKDYDASADGTYNSAPIKTALAGVMEGLGNSISHMTIAVDKNEVEFGLFYDVGVGGVLRDLGVADAQISNFGRAAFGGVISAANDGSIVACWTSGKAVIPSGSGVGGLVDVNGGTISRSYSLVRVGSDGGRSGGLVAFNLGTIERSFASGAVATTRGSS